MKKLLNPIANFDEKVLLVVGLLSLGLTIWLGYVMGFKLASIVLIDVNKWTFTEVARSAVQSVLMAIICYYILGISFNKRTRLVDIANTVLIAIIPLIFLSLVSISPWFASILGDNTESEKTILQMVGLFFYLLIILPLLILFFMWLYNGFKIATNLKSWVHIALFIVVTAALATFSPYLNK